MKTIWSIAAIAVLAGGASAGAQTKAPSTKDLYVTMCQQCHGPDGKPPIKEMGFAGRAWKTKTPAAAMKIIREGVPGTVMLPFKGRLTEAQIAALAKYVRALDKPAKKK